MRTYHPAGDIAPDVGKSAAATYRRFHGVVVEDGAHPAAQQAMREAAGWFPLEYLAANSRGAGADPGSGLSKSTLYGGWLRRFLYATGKKLRLLAGPDPILFETAFAGERYAYGMQLERSVCRRAVSRLRQRLALRGKRR